LAHAGRKCGVKEETTVSASALAFNEDYDVPDEMSLDDIKTVVMAFKAAAHRAQLAGFDTIEIHGAHGYLINQFLSPLSNKRKDVYGGSLVNRVRFLQEILQAVHQVWPKEKPIILRLSAEEYDVLGNHIHETIEIVHLIKEWVDGINVSSGGVVPVAISAYPGYQVPLSEAIKQACNIKTIAGGLITEPQMIEEILQKNQADFVYLGRALLRQPYFVLEAALAEQINIIPNALKRGFK
jgi:NADPH2 dehydrogenase